MSRHGLFAEHEIGHEVLDGLDHVFPVGHHAPGGLCRLEKRRHAVSGDHIADEHGRGEQGCVDREWSTRLNP